MWKGRMEHISQLFVIPTLVPSPYTDEGNETQARKLTVHAFTFSSSKNMSLMVTKYSLPSGMLV